ncbi:hypothetical protein QTP88_012530 [Uroleucon formosanum]
MAGNLFLQSNETNFVLSTLSDLMTIKCRKCLIIHKSCSLQWLEMSLAHSYILLGTFRPQELTCNDSVQMQMNYVIIQNQTFGNTEIRNKISGDSLSKAMNICDYGYSLLTYL